MSMHISRRVIAGAAVGGVGLVGLVAAADVAGAAGWSTTCGVDGYGRVTCIASDTNGDGVVDVYSYDLDVNGVIERVLADLDFDGYFETKASDWDQDGFIDVVEVDTDLDGALDSAVYPPGVVARSAGGGTTGVGPNGAAVLVPLARNDFDGDGVLDLFDANAVDSNWR